MNRLNDLPQPSSVQPLYAHPDSRPTPSGLPEYNAGARLPSRSTRRQSQDSSNERYFQQIAEAIPQLVWTTDGSGNLEYCNARYRAYSGMTLDELRTRLREEIHPEDAEFYLALWNASLASGNDLCADIRLRSATGEYRWFLTRACPIRDNSGRIIKWFGTCTDVHDERMWQEQQSLLLEQLVGERTAELSILNVQLETARDQALRALEQRAQFVATVSHEIRTPMSGVLGMTELLLTNQLDAESHEIAEHIYASASSLLTVVNDILDFSKLEAGKLRLNKVRFSVRKALLSAVASIMPVVQQKGLVVATHISPLVPDHVLGDDGRLRQVLLNLCHNAVKFMEAGELTISVDPIVKTGTMVVLRFSIQDTGIGISTEAQELLFSPFVQAGTSIASKYGGTGLGLSIAKALVELMSGEISVQSVEGRGSIFSFTAEFEI